MHSCAQVHCVGASVINDRATELRIPYLTYARLTGKAYETASFDKVHVLVQAEKNDMLKLIRNICSHSLHSFSKEIWYMVKFF